MTSIVIIILVVLLLSSWGALFVLARKIVWLERRNSDYINQVTGWQHEARLQRETHWAPEFVTSETSSDIDIRLIRQAVTGNGRRPPFNSLLVGSVDTFEDGWEPKLDALVLNARARMAELNAFIDSYSEPQL